MTEYFRIGVVFICMLLAAATSRSGDKLEDADTSEAAVAVSEASSLPEGPGREATLKGCLAGCHEMGIFDQNYSAQEWQQCVDDMVALGANIPYEDYGPIVLYLAKNLVREVDAP